MSTMCIGVGMACGSYTRKMTDEFDALIATRIHDLRAELAHEIEASPLTKSAIARASGQTRQHVGNISNEARGLSLETAFRLSEALGLRLQLVRLSQGVTVTSNDEGQLLEGYRRLSARGRRYMLSQLQIATNLNEDLLPSFEGDVGAMRRFMLDDDGSDTP